MDKHGDPSCCEERPGDHLLSGARELKTGQHTAVKEATAAPPTETLHLTAWTGGHRAQHDKQCRQTAEGERITCNTDIQRVHSLVPY